MAEDLEKAQTPAQIEQTLADQYLDGAVLARTVSYKALELALKQIEDGTLRDPAKTAMNAAITSGTLLDKRLILEGRPTQIVQTEDPKRAAQVLARRLGVAIEATATEIPAPETPSLPAAQNESLPLLSEGARGKRARVRAKRGNSGLAD